MDLTANPAQKLYQNVLKENCNGTITAERLRIKTILRAARSDGLSSAEYVIVLLNHSVGAGSLLHNSLYKEGERDCWMSWHNATRDKKLAIQFSAGVVPRTRVAKALVELNCGDAAEKIASVVGKGGFAILLCDFNVIKIYSSREIS